MPVTSWDPTPYPDPRKRRTVQTQPDDPGSVPFNAPRTFLWGLRLRETSLNTRALAGSPKLTGPVIIKDLSGTFFFASSGGVRTPIFGIYWNNAPYPITTQSQVAGSPPPGSPIYLFHRVSADAFLHPGSDGFTQGVGVTTSLTNSYFPINYVIGPGDVYLTAFIEMRANAGECYADCVLRCYHNVDPLTMGQLLN
jgi:hypothetical protein